MEPSRTCYGPPHLNVWQRVALDDGGLGVPPDPNADIPLCRDCAAEHHAQWDDRWAEYYGNLL